MPILRPAALVCCMIFVLPAHATTVKECTEKFDGAKKSGTLQGIGWSEFRETQCDIHPDIALDQKSQAQPAAAIQIPEGVTFPDKIDNKFAAERPAQQRMKTCLDSYRANRDAKTLNGIKWIQKGGGYYSFCNARLKGNL